MSTEKFNYSKGRCKKLLWKFFFSLFIFLNFYALCIKLDFSA